MLQLELLQKNKTKRQYARLILTAAQLHFLQWGWHPVWLEIHLQR